MPGGFLKEKRKNKGKKELGWNHYKDIIYYYNNRNKRLGGNMIKKGANQNRAWEKGAEKVWKAKVTYLL